MQASLNQIWKNKNYRYAMIIALLMVLWLASGFVIGNDDESKPSKSKVAQKETLTQVRAMHVHAETFPLRVVARGKTESDRYVDVKAEVAGQVDRIEVQKGERVQRGDVICRLAVEDRALRLQEAQSNVEQAQIEYDGSMRLKTGGYQSQNAIAASKLKLDTAKANLLRRKIDLEKTEIRAPFAGVLDLRPAEEGALMRSGDVCARVLDLNPLVVSGQLSEADVVKITTNSEADVRLVTGEILKGKVRYVSRSSDDVTRTYRIEVAVENPEMRLFSGVTAEIVIYTGTTQAHLVSASLLMLADDGKLGIRVLDEDNKVEYYDVEIVGDAADGVWVTGLPDQIRLITVGQEYVGEGETVDVTFVDQVSKKAAQQLVEGDVATDTSSSLDAIKSGSASDNLMTDDMIDEKSEQKIEAQSEEKLEALKNEF